MPLTVQGFIDLLVQRRLWLVPKGKWDVQLFPRGSVRKLSPDERAFLSMHRRELRSLAEAGPLGWSQPETQPQLQSQPVAVPAQPPSVSPVPPKADPTTPEVYARGVRITEAHVEQTMEAAGDLDDYRKGRISKVEAYERARVRQRQLQELYGIR